jgi:hypothetical protein
MSTNYLISAEKYFKALRAADKLPPVGEKMLKAVQDELVVRVTEQIAGWKLYNHFKKLKYEQKPVKKAHKIRIKLAHKIKYKPRKIRHGKKPWKWSIHEN